MRPVRRLIDIAELEASPASRLFAKLTERVVSITDYDAHLQAGTAGIEAVEAIVKLVESKPSLRITKRARYLTPTVTFIVGVSSVSAMSTPYYPGKPPSIVRDAALGAAVGFVMANVPPPMRRWMISMFLLAVAVIYTIQKPPRYEPFGANATSNADYAAILRMEDDFFGLGYQFPWYCIALIVAFWTWGVFGYIRAWRLCTIYRQQRRLEEEQMSFEQAQHDAACFAAERKAAARDTAEAMVNAMQDVVQRQAAPSAPAQASQRRRTTVAPAALPAGPQSPTGPSQRPVAPKPAPPAPMGTSTPKLWVPTYSGAAVRAARPDISRRHPHGRPPAHRPGRAVETSHTDVVVHRR